MKTRIFIDARYGTLVKMAVHPDGIYHELERRKVTSDVLFACFGRYDDESNDGDYKQFLRYIREVFSEKGRDRTTVKDR